MVRSLSLIFFSLFLVKLGAQELKWIYKIGGTTAESGVGITIDSDQNIYDITNFMGTVLVSSSVTFSSKGAEDILIRKSTSLGILQWVKQIGSKGQDLSADIVHDLDDNIYVTGTFTDSLYFENQLVLKGSSQKMYSFVIKINEVGALVWAKQMESSISVSARALSSGSTGDLFLSGNFEGAAILGDGFTNLSKGGSDIFLAKLNPMNGQTLSVKQIGGIDQDFVQQHVTDNSGNIYMTGDYRQTIDLDPGTAEFLATTKGLTDIFIVKINAGGLFQWAKSYGGIGTDYGQSLDVDQEGNVIATGRFSENVSFGNTSQVLKSVGSTDIYIVKLNANGNTQWVNGYGDAQNDSGNRVIINKNGVIYVAGLYRGKVDFNPSLPFNNSSESRGGADAFIAIYNQDGTYNDHFTLGGIANEQINDLELKNNGELISTGGFGAITDFDPTSSEINIFSNGGLDAFLWNTFVCVNPYIKSIKVEKSELCFGEKALIRVEEGYLNGATQWSWQRDSCGGITFASGDFLNLPVSRNTSFFVKGFGGCAQNDPCRKIDIKVFKDSLRYQVVNLCQGDTVKIGNSNYTAAGVFVDSLQSKSGCDSVLVTEIFMYPKYQLSQSVSICEGDSVKIGNSVFKFAGTFATTLPTVNGCDSVIVTTVNVLPSKIENAEAIICQGDSVKIRQITYYTAGTYVQTNIGPNGCKDLLIVKIIELPTSFFNKVTLCDGDSIKVGNSIYKTKGIYVDRLISTLGCDSIITTDISTAKNSLYEQNVSICKGDSIKVGAKVYKATGNFRDTIFNQFGCDSIILTDLRVYNVPAPVQRVVKICEGDSIRVGSKVHKNTGFYRDTLLTIFGCDSIINTDLKIAPRFYFVQNDICTGQNVEIGNQIFTGSGVYTVSLKNYFGCDSIIVLNLKLNDVIRKSIDYKICPGESVKVGIKLYTQPGVYLDTLSSAKGCDSIVTSKLIFNHVVKDLTYNICEGSEVTVNNIKYNQEGIYRDTITKADGCDSVLNIKIVVNKKYVTFAVFEICKGAGLTIGGSTYFNAGAYTELLSSVKGCDSTVNFEIKIVNFVPIFYAVKDTLKAIQIEGAKYQWYECVNGERVQILGASKSDFVLFKSGKYALGITYMGCTYFSDCKDFFSTGIVQQTNDPWFTVFPNPADLQFTIRSDKDSKLIIRDIRGRILFKTTLSQGDHQIDVSSWVTGIYILEMTSGRSTYKSKLVIK